jgi:hypothetical protein
MDAVRDATQTIKALKDDLHQTAGYGLPEDLGNGYSTAKPTASPKIEAARMISVKLIDMVSSSPGSKRPWEARLRPITLDGFLKTIVCWAA